MLLVKLPWLSWIKILVFSKRRVMSDSRFNKHVDRAAYCERVLVYVV